MAFKLGPQGLGYYKDSPPSLALYEALFPATLGPPLQLALDDLLFAQLTTSPSPSALGSSPGRRFLASSAGGLRGVKANVISRISPF